MKRVYANNERTNFYNPEDLEEFKNNTGVRIYQTLPMLDLLRNVNEYDTFNLAQQEEIHALFNEFAADVMEDLKQLKEGNVDGNPTA